MLNISNDKIYRLIALTEHLNNYENNRSSNEQLLTFVNELSIEELSDVIALMYFGRGDSSFSYLKEQFGAYEELREDFVNKIFEKRIALPRYLQDGLSQLGVDY